MELTAREVALIEELGMAKRIMEIQRLCMTALVTRVGGEAKIEHVEILHIQNTYELIENIQSDGAQTSVILRVRLK